MTSRMFLYAIGSSSRRALNYARGTVCHSSHETITLPIWHRVLMNTETQSRTMANVAFLDSSKSSNKHVCRNWRWQKNGKRNICNIYEKEPPPWK